MNDVKPLALVTGASSGIGFELAMQLAERGYDLIINAENENGLRQAAQQIRAVGVSVEAVRADLRHYDQVEELWTAVTAAERPLDVAVLNAGVGQGGAFADTDLADELEIVDLNVRSTVHLAKRVVRQMVDRGRGRILVTSSIASTIPGTFQAVYNASKSFVQSLTQALQSELKDTGVTLTALMPGPTETDFFHRAEMDDTQVGRQEKDDPAEVAREGLDALFAGRDKVIAGSAGTKAQGIAAKVVPDKLKAEAHRKLAEPGSGDQD
ncbi:SDR family oxidoreductase [Streptomyces sp. BV129]|uniref:SDR family NAD(P)-dependent oxidoreductase n=1 Tax=Streptomyces sp. BV129 TaxID=2849671 RepID=UPI001C2E0114|nr:SDR family NAD(P)-dependent oxidoreductase [Streptomyces sp. BV129]MBV1946681.1 SDR family NAD(P)-dependent oxidoreductase [Streptomyces sp. BV129]